jgi:hypothetical protein
MSEPKLILIAGDLKVEAYSISYGDRLDRGHGLVAFAEIDFEAKWFRSSPDAARFADGATFAELTVKYGDDSDALVGLDVKRHHSCVWFGGASPMCECVRVVCSLHSILWGSERKSTGLDLEAPP